MTKRTTLSWLGVLLLLLSLAACGGAGSDEAVAEAANNNNHSNSENQANDDHHGDDDHHANDDQHANDDHHANDDRHDDGHDAAEADGQMHMHADVPEEFAGLANPLEATAANIAAGEALFEAYCVTCHGAFGEGDGPGSVGLDPQPANLADGMMMAMIGDDYIFWRINKGGAIEPFNSAMPTWELALDETQVWQLVLYVRTLPEHEHEGAGHD